jgi:uncharacterized protein (TIGR00266 family)
METRITGDSLPVVTCKLNKGESIITENGGMSWMSNGLKMDTNTNGGLLKGLGRALSGESIFMNVYTAEEDGAEIAFASSFPGRILEFDLAKGECIIAQKKAFLCSESTVSLSMHFQKKLGAGLFGGEGFIMQKITGSGIVFIEIDGANQEFELTEGQQLILSTGYLVSIEETCKMDVQTVKGLKNIILGGEGIFNTVITGPGKVVAQTMPLPKLANSLVPFLPQQINTTTSSGNDGIDAAASIFKMFTKK